MGKLLSVIVPVYMVEKYIDKCLSSLIVPDEYLFKKIEVLVINDGTPDKSADMAREYEKQYPGVFRVIDQENRGHGGAWNHGTELATGKYLFYLDSDDWFDTTDLAKLIEYISHCDTDMILLDGKNYYAELDTYIDRGKHDELEPEKIYEVDKFDWLATGHGYDMTYAHDTVYRTYMMQQYLPLFCEHVMYDDVSLHVIPIAIAKDFVYTKLNIYRYYIGRPGQSFDPAVRAIRAADDVTKVLKFVLDWIVNHRDIIPKGGTCEKWVEESYQSFGTWHYRELSLFNYKTAKPRLMKWDEYIKITYPDIRPNIMVIFYRILPFPIYFVCFKVVNFVRRCKNWIKRKLKSK